MPERRKDPHAEAVGQTNLGWELDTHNPDPTKVYICRSCFSHRISGPIRTTVDPRWVHATCLDCGNRVIANVMNRAIKHTTEEGDPSHGKK